MSQVISTRLPDRTAERLKQLAREWGKTPSETSAILIEESLRESEFPYIEFRQSPTESWLLLYLSFSCSELRCWAK